MTNQSQPKTRFRLILGGLLIVILVFAVYSPILPGTFLMDDERLIGADNPLVNGSLTPASLWFRTDFTLATFGWWLEDLCFGRNPAGFHVVNVLLQAISGILLWRLLALLKIPGAWLAAAAFTVHPVAVCTVARVAELKNTLSMPFYLLSLIGYLRYEAAVLYPEQMNPGGKPESHHHATLWLTISLLSFVLALLAKTTVVMLPVILLMLALWRRRRVTTRDWWHLSPYFVLSLGFGLMSVWFQKHQALTSTHEVLQPSSVLERVANAGHDFWFYLCKTLLPVNLSVVYSQWKINTWSVTAFLPDLLLVALFALCWWFRRGWGWHALLGLGCFAVALFPALGFFDAQFMTMWQVSDHLQYIPMIAPVALASAALANWLKPDIFCLAALLVILTLCGLGYRRAEAFRTEESLMRDTIAKNAAAWPAHTDLGVVLAKQGNIPGAINEFKKALQDQPGNQDIHRDLGHAYLAQGKLAEAETETAAALKINPGDPVLQRDDADVLEALGKNDEAVKHLLIASALKPDVETQMDLATLFYMSGNPNQAARQLRRALAINPDQPEALKTLAWILATSSNDSLRNGNEALRDARQACQLTEFKHPEIIAVLGAAYAETGQFPQAIAAAELAGRLATQAGDQRWMAISGQLLTRFRADKPWRE
jgi:tetratricopeptide (TPR) repeat protein